MNFRTLVESFIDIIFMYFVSLFPEMCGNNVICYLIILYFLHFYNFQHLNDRISYYWQLLVISFCIYNYQTPLGPHQYVMFVDDKLYWTILCKCDTRVKQHTYSKTLLCRQQDCFLDKHSYYIRRRQGTHLLGDSTASWKSNQIFLYINNIYMN